ncbi:MAG: hypothetical protein A4S09_04150 [Proteobacteria bacterium SG_bin7]|nr:MAG: hypothetical protein A4S09_04150 [Proteobacteria bacterium SG_bin7]
MKEIVFFATFLFSFGSVASDSVSETLKTKVEVYAKDLFAAYQDLHTNPELSFKEAKTSEKIAQNLKTLGYEVTKEVGKTGVVGVLKNGKGPTLLIRTDMDALPVEENTGFKFSSQNKGVMHACGHDIHMTVFLGTARFLAEEKSRWKGTLVMMAQPAEELGAGALAMLKDGLFKKFPTPTKALALHVNSSMESGRVGFRSGFSMANVDSLDIEVKGVGGHGAYPHKTKDPIVLASQMVMGFQTLISRETSPLDSGVVTVGVFQAGTKSNIIPDSAMLKLTIRSYKDEVREKLVTGVKRIAMGMAEAAGIPNDRKPTFRDSENYTPAVYNDPTLTNEAMASVRKILGDDNVQEIDPVMGGEDFGQLGRQSPKIPIVMFFIGAVPKNMMKEFKKKNMPLPSLHSSTFTPDWELTIKTGIKAMAMAAVDQLVPKDQ